MISTTGQKKKEVPGEGLETSRSILRIMFLCGRIGGLTDFGRERRSYKWENNLCDQLLDLSWRARKGRRRHWCITQPATNGFDRVASEGQIRYGSAYCDSRRSGRDAGVENTAH